MDKLMAEEYGCDKYTVGDQIFKVCNTCDGLMCSAGTFHPSGAASEIGGCQPCPKTELAEEFEPKLSAVLGRSSCESARYLVGDMNSDGKVSPREALRYIYYTLNGSDWGDKYKPWRDMKVNECDLQGIACTDGKVTKIDLSEANVCADNSNMKQNNAAAVCPGLPGEIRYLSETLEEFHAKHRPYFRGSIPSEIGLLSWLRILDLPGCPLLTGTLPSEIGLLTNLQQLDLSEGSFDGILPSSLGSLTALERINLNLNSFTGTMPSEIGLLTRLKEMRMSRAYLNGTLPSSLGNMNSLENIEIYSNEFTGSIPHELGELKALKRIGKSRVLDFRFVVLVDASHSQVLTGLRRRQKIFSTTTSLDLSLPRSAK